MSRFHKIIRPVYFLCFGFLLILPGILGSPLLVSAQRSERNNISSGESGEWWTQAQENIRKSEYHVRWAETPVLPGIKPAYQSPNRAHNLRIYYQPEGLQIVNRIDTSPTWLWEWFPHQPELTFAEPLQVQENQVEYRGKTIQQKYINSDFGLLQQLVVSDELFDPISKQTSLSFGIKTSLTTHNLAGGSIEFRHQGKPVMKYGGIHAYDSNNQVLPVRFIFKNSKGFSSSDADGLIFQYELGIEVDTSQAEFPITIGALITGLSTAPDWYGDSNQADAHFGISVASAGDVNGDMYGDVVVGVPGYDNTHSDDGAVFIYHGGPTGLSNVPTLLLSTSGDSQFGASVASADVNGDGYSDILVGAPNGNIGESLGEGVVHVYYGALTGVDNNRDWYAEGAQSYAKLGTSVAPAGDVNGDGYGDFIVGAPMYDYSGRADIGMACVWFGSNSGLGPNGNPSNADWCTYGSNDDDQYGLVVGFAGDVNGDRFSDVFVASQYYDYGFTNNGRVLVFHGSNTNFDVYYDWEATVYEDFMYFGVAVSTAGDVNGDGYSDIVVGADEKPNDGRSLGWVFLWYGSSSGVNSGTQGIPANAVWSQSGEQTNSGYGQALATAGDVNGDGYADLLVGSSFYDVISSDEGKAYVYHGSANGLSMNADWNDQGDQDGGRYGYSVATAGDVNGDGYSDVIIGAPYFENSQTDEGMAFLYQGGPGTLSNVSGWSYIGDYSGMDLGYTVASAGDVNGDGFADIIVGAPYYDSLYENEGAVFVWYGSAYGPSATVDWWARSEQAQAQLGRSVANAGDVNGDGYTEIIAGAPYYDNGQQDEGMAFIWKGSSSGVVGVGNPSSAYWRAESNQQDALLGVAVAGAGDVNGDGYADIIVGASNYDNGEVDEGIVLVWYGGEKLGWSGNPLNASWSMDSNTAGLHLGLSVAGAGDVDRDGYSDVIAGASNWAFGWYGSNSGLNPTGIDWWGVGSSDLFGASVNSAGDVNGDGYADVVVGAPLHTLNYTLEGKAQVFCGGQSGLAFSPCWVDYGGKSNAWFGWSVSGAGDLNGDGYADIVVGAPYWTNGHSQEGQARVYYGGNLGLISFNGGDWNIESNLTDATLGFSVAGVGDVNGDAYADLLIGIPGESSERGRVRMFYGNGVPGRSLIPQQLRYNDSVNIANLGLSDSKTSIIGAMHPANPGGRGFFTICWEVKHFQTDFNNMMTQTDPKWFDSGTPVFVGFMESGLAEKTLYHWRVRYIYDLVSNPYNSKLSRWFTQPWNGWDEADFRTNYTRMVYLPIIVKSP